MATTTAQDKAKTQADDSQSDMQDLKEQFDILKIEMKAMTDMIGKTAKHRVEDAKHLAEDARDDALARMELMGNRARAQVDDLHADAYRAVASNPLTALAVAAGIGFLFGALSRK